MCASLGCPKDDTRQCAPCTCRLSSTSRATKSGLGDRREAEGFPGHISLPSLVSAPKWLNCDVYFGYLLLISVFSSSFFSACLYLSRGNWVLNGSFLDQPIPFTSFRTEGGGGGVSDTRGHSGNIVDIQSRLHRQALPSLEAARGRERNKAQIAMVPGNLNPHTEAPGTATTTVFLGRVFSHHGLSEQDRRGDEVCSHRSQPCLEEKLQAETRARGFQTPAQGTSLSRALVLPCNLSNWPLPTPSSRWGSWTTDHYDWCLVTSSVGVLRIMMSFA